MSIIGNWKKLVMGHTLQFDGGGGGGGSPQPTSSTTQTSNIPEYARPYVETMLGATQQQLFNTEAGPDGTTNITGVKPYQPYSTNMQDYVAPFSPMQQKAQQGVADMALPSQYGQGTGAALMGTAQALTAGQRYANQATNPYAMQGYMNPYLESALNPALNEISRQYDITGTKEMSDATRSGAFGGNREALMAAENQRNKNMAMNQAIGQGYNQAFNQAQQAQQYGANLGLQGAQAGIQGGQALAGIGGQGLQAEQGILSAQQAVGAAQQAQQQQMINQAIQNYATAQQYPQQQLAFMNAQIRGLPMQTMTTQGYQAAPSAVSQAAGLGTAGIAGLGLYNAMNK
jgi:hypothetical protein